MNVVKIVGAIPLIGLGILGVCALALGEGGELPLLCVTIGTLTPGLCLLVVGIKNLAGIENPVADTIAVGASLIVAIVCAIAFALSSLALGSETGSGAGGDGQPETIDGIEWVLYFGEIETNPRVAEVPEKVTEDDSEGYLDSYYVHSERDLSFDNVKRYEYRLIITKQLKKQQITEIVDNFIEKQKKEKPFNAMTILLFDDERFISNDEFAPTLGSVDYAPQGEWGRANAVSTGDYSSMKMKNSIVEKQWELKPTEEEIQVFYAWKSNAATYKQETGEESLQFDKYPKYLSNIIGLDPETIEVMYFNAGEWRVY